MSSNLEELLKTIKERAEYHAYSNNRYNVENRRSYSTWNHDFELKNSLNVKWRENKDYSFCEIYSNDKKIFSFETSNEGEDFYISNKKDYGTPIHFINILKDFKKEFDESTKWYKKIKEMLDQKNKKKMQLK
tara:strand:+ start:30953 stop:31348 length:396 start_codon:yes stop_codon:yes gene_type:complete